MAVDDFCDETILTDAGLIHASGCDRLCGGGLAPKPVICQTTSSLAVGSQFLTGLGIKKRDILDPTVSAPHTFFVSHCHWFVSSNYMQIEYKEARSSPTGLDWSDGRTRSRLRASHFVAGDFWEM